MTARAQRSARPGRALVVAYCFPPHAAIGTHRTLRLVSHLVDAGWDVDVLTADADTYLPGTPVDDNLVSRVRPEVRVVRSHALRGFTHMGRVIGSVRGPRREAAASVGVAAVPPSAPSSVGTLHRTKRMVEELCAMPDKDVGWVAPAIARGWRAFTATRPDVIFSSAPPWSTHLVAQALAGVFKCRWVADFRDPWVRSPWVRYHTRPALAVARRLERRVVERADALVFTTDTARREFAAHYGPRAAERFHVVFNGCDASEFPPDRHQAGDGRVTLLHAGTLYGGRSPVPLLRAVAALRAREGALASSLFIRFLGATEFAGTDLKRLCAGLGLAGVVEFAARVTREESLEQMREAAGLLILQSGTAMAIPGKLYEYLAAGRPIFALCEEGEMADFIRSNRLGIAVSASSETEIEEGLRQFLGLPFDTWTRPHARLYDGRLRAAELGAIVTGVLPPPAAETICVA